MTGIFDQHFVRADRGHAIVDAVAAASGLAFDAVKRPGMHDRARGPRSSRVYPETPRSPVALRLTHKNGRGHRGAASFCRIIARDDPRARNWIFPQFHKLKTVNRQGEHCRMEESTQVAQSS